MSNKCEIHKRHTIVNIQMHDWEYPNTPDQTTRKCKKCGLRQRTKRIYEWEDLN